MYVDAKSSVLNNEALYVNIMECEYNVDLRLASPNHTAHVYV